MEWTGRVFIITGANSGLGRETVLGIVRSEKDVLVVLACRNETSAEEAIDHVISTALAEKKLDTERARQKKEQLKSRLVKCEITWVAGRLII